MVESNINKISPKAKKIIKIINIIFYVLVVAIILNTVINYSTKMPWVETNTDNQNFMRQVNTLFGTFMGFIYIIFAIIVKKIFNFLVKKFIK